MGEYYAFHKTVKGYLHGKKGIDCEDCSASFFSQNADERKRFYIAVVADGHGDTACMRSKTGSKKAVEIAMDCLKEFAENVVHVEQEADGTQKPDEFKGYRSIVDMLASAAAYGRNAKDTLKARVPESLTNAIVSRWHQFVKEDIRKHEITEEEMAQASRYADAYREGKRLEHIYGTTLIAALMLPDYLLLIQQGDGRCDVFYEDGTVDQPIPWDERCHENVTTSMCDEDVATRIRSHVIDLREKKVIACFLGSDGVEDAYRDMEGTHMFYRSLIAELVERGTDAFEAYLQKMLPQFSETGSGDDVSVSGIVDIEHASVFVPTFQLQNKQYNLKEDLDRYESRIISMSRKHGILRENVDEAKKECEKLSNRLRMACAECNKVDEDNKKYVIAIEKLEQQAKEDEIKRNQFIQQRKELVDLQYESTRNNGRKDIISNLKYKVSQFINPADMEAYEQKIDEYSVQIKSLKIKINNIEKDCQKACNMSKALKDKKSKLEQQISFVENNLSIARKQVQKAQQDFAEYDQEYQSIQAEIERIQQEITLLDKEKKHLDSHKYIYQEKNKAETKTNMNTGLEQKQKHAQGSNSVLDKEANPQRSECYSAEIQKKVERSSDSSQNLQGEDTTPLEKRKDIFTDFNLQENAAGKTPTDFPAQQNIETKILKEPDISDKIKEAEISENSDKVNPIKETEIQSSVNKFDNQAQQTEPQRNIEDFDNQAEQTEPQRNVEDFDNQNGQTQPQRNVENFDNQNGQTQPRRSIENFDNQIKETEAQRSVENFDNQIKETEAQTSVENFDNQIEQTEPQRNAENFDNQNKQTEPQRSDENFDNQMEQTESQRSDENLDKIDEIETIKGQKEINTIQFENVEQIPIRFSENDKSDIQ